MQKITITEDMVGKEVVVQEPPQIEPPEQQWETLFDFKQGYLSGGELERCRGELERCRPFRGRVVFGDQHSSKLTVVKQSPRITSSGQLECIRRVGTRQQIQIRPCVDRWAHEWYLETGHTYRFTLSFKTNGFDELMGKGEWWIPIEIWGPAEGHTEKHRNPVVSLIAKNNQWYLRLDAGDRSNPGQEMLQQEPMFSFHPGWQTWVIEYRPDPENGVLRATMDNAVVADIRQVPTQLTKDDAEAMGGCVNIGVYGRLGRGFTYSQIKIEELKTHRKVA